MKSFAERAAMFQRCCDQLRALYRPMTAEELAEFEQLKAKEMSRAEARRNPSPQMEMDT